MTDAKIMKFSALKGLVKRNGDRFVLMDNDEPQIVMLSFEEYARMASHVPVSPQSDNHRFSVPQTAARHASDSAVTDARIPDPGLINAEFDERGERPAEDDMTLSQDGNKGRDTGPRTKGLPLRLEDLRLEDLPL